MSRILEVLEVALGGVLLVVLFAVGWWGLLELVPATVPHDNIDVRSLLVGVVLGCICVAGAWVLRER